MALHIKALDGPYKNHSFLLIRGFVIGRAEGDLRIHKDTRLSGRHAVVEADERGTLYLADADSKNGIRVNGEQVKRVKLVPGLQIVIGSYTYEIIDQPLQEAAPAAAPAPPPKPKARHWQDILIEFVKNSKLQLKNEARPLLSLHPAVILDFIRGCQAETRWVLGYGPRKVGTNTLDLSIFEPSAPDVCFEILPTPEGISFKTSHPSVVKLNGQGVRAGILHIGDIIKIHDTEIEVDFIE